MRRYCNEIARHALEVLQLLTLAPAARHRLLEAFPEPSAAGHTDGISVLLDVAHGVPYSNDPEVSLASSARSCKDTSWKQRPLTAELHLHHACPGSTRRTGCLGAKIVRNFVHL